MPDSENDDKEQEPVNAQDAVRKIAGAIKDASKFLKPTELANTIGQISSATGVTGVVGNVHKAVVEPAWKQVTEGETRWFASTGVAIATGLQYVVPHRFILKPYWLLPSLVLILLIILMSTSPGKATSTSKYSRPLSLAIIAFVSFSNIVSGGRLIDALVHGTDHLSAPRLLLTGGCIWLTNVIVFGLWYWESDRGGPVARAMATKPYPDFLFPQMQDPTVAPPNWEPKFVDYIYMSFTNATAFSPTDVLPLTRWAKLTMMLQSAVSLSLVALVIARAVNILK